MKRTLSLVAAFAVLGAANAQIAWRDMRVEGQWRAVAQDGSGATATLWMYSNGRFEADVTSPDRGEIQAWGAYAVSLDNSTVVPNMETVTLRFDRRAISGDMLTPPRFLKLAFFPEAEWPTLTDGAGLTFFPSGYRAFQPAVWTRPYLR